jgi:hypothetical protein
MIQPNTKGEIGVWLLVSSTQKLERVSEKDTQTTTPI